MQIQKYKYKIHKYTNTAYDKVPEKNTIYGIFLKRGLFKDIKNYIPMCRTHKYKIQIHKYTNTAYDEVPEWPNMWHIFEKRIVQGCQKLYSHTTQTWKSEFRTVVRGLLFNYNSPALKRLDSEKTRLPERWSPAVAISDEGTTFLESSLSQPDRQD